MTARLPTPGSDDGTWGDILNSFLQVSHNTDGTLSSNALSGAGAVMSGSTASGDLSGTYPGPKVSKINGISITGTPGNGQLLTATSSTSATWQTSIPATPAIVTAGNLGSSYTLNLAMAETWLVGTLNANCALTLSGLSAGYTATILITQDATGYRNLSVNGVSVNINAMAGASTIVNVQTPDGTTIYISVPNFTTESGKLITSVLYAPAPAVSYTSGSGTFTAIDSANLTASFVAPLSGKVWVEALYGYHQAGGYVGSGLVDHTTGTVVGQASFCDAAKDTHHSSHLVTGLTPGQAYQWDLAFNSASSSNQINVGNYNAGGTSYYCAPAGMAIFAM